MYCKKAYLPAIVIIALIVALIPSSVFAENNTSVNENYQIDTEAELLSELSGIDLSNDRACEEIIEETNPDLMADYLADKMCDLADIASEVSLKGDSQSEFNYIAKQYDEIESIKFTKEDDESSDSTITKTRLMLKDGSEVEVETLDEPDNDALRDILSGAIIYKLYGDRRYTAKYSFKYCGINCFVQNRICYNLNKAKRSITKNSVHVKDINQGNTFAGGSIRVTVSNAYADTYGKKTDADGRQYLYCNGVYNFATSGYFGGQTARWLRMNAFVVVRNWGPIEVTLDQFATHGNFTKTP